MSVAWSTPRDGEPEPEHIYIVVGIGFGGAERGTVATAYRELAPVPYALPDELQPDVIEPTALLKPIGRTRYEVESP
jgi:hypothetical protein